MRIHARGASYRSFGLQLSAHLATLVWLASG